MKAVRLWITTIFVQSAFIVLFFVLFWLPFVLGFDPPGQDPQKGILSVILLVKGAIISVFIGAIASLPTSVKILRKHEYTITNTEITIVFFLKVVDYPLILAAIFFML